CVSAPWRFSSDSDREAIRKWTCESLKAGRMVPPRASIIRVRRSHSERTCLSDPDVAMRSAATATPVAPSRGGQTLPLTTASVAFGSASMAAFVAHAARQCRVMARLDARLPTDLARASTLPSTAYLDPAIL